VLIASIVIVKGKSHSRPIARMKQLGFIRGRVRLGNCHGRRHHLFSAHRRRLHLSGTRAAWTQPTQNKNTFIRAGGHSRLVCASVVLFQTQRR